MRNRFRFLYDTRHAVMCTRRELIQSTGLAGLWTGAAVLGSAETHTNVDDTSGITDVAGLRVGHFTDSRRPTGCTVVIFDEGGTVGVDVRGSAPGTRETDLLQPINTVQKINAILLSGGSAFGLDAASGVMRFLEEQGKGFKVGRETVPLVSCAVLFDLALGNGKVRPDANAGYSAAKGATSSRVPEGNVGAGAGATVGKLFGIENGMKSGLGTASLRIGNTGVVMGAIVAVNAVGDVLDLESNKILAGARTKDGRQFLDSNAQLLRGTLAAALFGSNTTIGVIATNSTLTKIEVTKVAQMAQDGLARTIRPVHTAFDGDTLFAASTGTARNKVDVTTLGTAAAEAVARAVNRAVLRATGIPGYPAHRDLQA